MDKKSSMSMKGVSVIAGIMMASVFSSRYSRPSLSDNLGKASRFLELIKYNLNGYGLLWCIAAGALAWLFYLTIRQDSFKPGILEVLLSLVFGFISVCGNSMYYSDHLIFRQGLSGLLQTIFYTIGGAVVFRLVMFWASYFLDRRILDDPKGSIGSNSSGAGACVKFFGSALILFVLGWGIWIYAYYPASFDIDCWRQLASYYSYKGFFPENHHPWFSTCVLAFFHSIGEHVGDEGLGIFLYVIIRDILLAVLYTRIAYTSYRSGHRIVVCYGILLYYALTPVWGAYAKHAFKDTASIGLFAWAILTVVIIIRKIREGEKPEIRYYFECATALLFACLFRGNVIYAVMPMLVLLMATVLYSTRQFYPVVILIMPVLLYTGYNHYITASGVRPGDVRELLSLPLQQTARTVRDHEKEISPEKKEVILQYLQFASLEELGKAYDPILSDPVKSKTVNAIELNDPVVKNYLRIWFQMAKEYPISYIEAAFGLSYGYYAFVPNQQAEGAGNWNSGMTLLDGMHLEGYGYVPERQDLRDTLTALAGVWDNCPLLCITDICAAYFWTTIILAVYWLKRHRFLELFPVVGVILIADTCMVSPVNDCFRYFSLAAVCLPVLLLLETRNDNESKSQERDNN